jgi:hypothetical protein
MAVASPRVSLPQLDMSNNVIGGRYDKIRFTFVAAPAEPRTLCEALCHCGSLTSLSLATNCLGPQGGVAVASVLRGLPLLVEVRTERGAAQ